ncbi:MAG: 50S ribosomal protein L19 [Lentisphaeria bacterium]
MSNNIFAKLAADQMKVGLPKLEVGDNVKVSVSIVEGAKERIQIFQGIIIAINGSEITKTITVRRVSAGQGVERVFPLHSPSIRKVEIVGRNKVRRAKLYYLRGLSGKAARLKPRDI